MEYMNTIFVGSGTALITPFTKDGVDYDSFGKLIDFQLENRTDALIICGTTGESSTMPDDEHIEVIEFAVKRVNKRVPVIAGTGTNDTAHSIDLSVRAEKVGADALLLVTPYYNKTSQKGLEAHFRAIADAVNIPVILYNVPSRTGMNISVDCVKALAGHKNIAAVKEASGDMSYAVRLFAECGDVIDIYSGNDDVIIPFMSLGAKGVISVVSNIMPVETHDMVAKYIEGDVETAKRLQLDMLDLINALFTEVNPIPVKTAVSLTGMQGGLFRSPLCEIGEGNLEVLKKALKKHNLIT